MKKVNQRQGHNFWDSKGKLYLVWCYACDRENYGPVVVTGECAWCGWKEKKPGKRRKK